MSALKKINTFTTSVNSGMTYIPRVETIPSSPTNLSGVAGIEEVSLTWDAPVDGKVDMYKIRVQEFVSGREVIVATSASTTVTIQGLIGGLEYRCSVISVIADKESSPLSFLLITPLVIPVPINLVATAGIESATVTWDPPAAGDIEAYKLYVSETISGELTIKFYLISSAVTVIRLTAGVQYNFYVTSIMRGRESSPSVITTATPRSPLGPDIPVGAGNDFSLFEIPDETNNFELIAVEI